MEPIQEKKEEEKKIERPQLQNLPGSSQTKQDPRASPARSSHLEKASEPFRFSPCCFGSHLRWDDEETPEGCAYFSKRDPPLQNLAVRDPPNLPGRREVISRQEFPNPELERLINDSINRLLDNLPALPSENFTIHRVPKKLRMVSEEAYTPMVVEIGPFHHKRLSEPNASMMRLQKVRYLKSMFQKHPTPRNIFVKRLLELEKSARGSYGNTFPTFTKEMFVEMMIVDGCFIVELIRQYNFDELRNENDPIFKNDGIFNSVHRDILLLENQLPFFVLESLFTLINHADYKGFTNHSFLQLTNEFLGHYEPFVGDQPFICNQRLAIPPNYIQHLNHLFLQSFTFHTRATRMPTKKIGATPKTPSPNKDLAFIPSATEIHEAGIKFQSTTKIHEAGINFLSVTSGNLLNVEFVNGVLGIPSLLVDDRTESLFRNLLAVEQILSSRATQLTDYVILMDCLINTSADVALLRDCGIIDNCLGDNKQVAQLFNKLCSGIATPSEFVFSKIFADVNVFYKTRWHAWKAKLKRDYFNTPWATISFIAAVFLLICTLVQTVCSIIQVV